MLYLDEAHRMMF